MRKETAVIAIIVAAVAGFVVGNMTAKKGQGGEGTEAEPAGGRVAGAPADGEGGGTPDLFKVPVGNSPFKGERDALVTIVEFSDFQ